VSKPLFEAKPVTWMIKKISDKMVGKQRKFEVLWKAGDVIWESENKFYCKFIRQTGHLESLADYSNVTLSRWVLLVLFSGGCAGNNNIVPT